MQLRLAAGLDLQHQIQNSAGEASICLLPVMEDEPAYTDQVQQVQWHAPNPLEHLNRYGALQAVELSTTKKESLRVLL